MTPRITPEMRAALALRPGGPIEVEDDQSHARYLLVDAQQAHAMAEQWIRAQLEVGLEDSDRGKVVPFDAEAIKAAGRSHLAICC